MKILDHNKSPEMLALLYTFLLLLIPGKASFFARIFKINRSSPLLIEEKK